MDECSGQLDKLESEYAQAEIRIETYHEDNAFAQLKSKLGHKLHIVARDVHVGRIEREIRSHKERGRCMVAATPFCRITKLMYDELQLHVSNI
mmetsp:Transcript_1239/g.1764  ORF Transcript_1239/g.1764 Transcript_1239/m.1764 type:complete len:93 (-) Transcript_1239:2716-2994(-)